MHQFLHVRPIFVVLSNPMNYVSFQNHENEMKNITYQITLTILIEAVTCPTAAFQ